MSRFINDTTKVVVSVDDSKDDRYPPSAGWSPADEPKKAPARKSSDKS